MPRALRRESSATDGSLITCATLSLYRGRRVGAATSAAAPSDLADAGCGAGGRSRLGAERGLVYELVLDHSVVHVRRSHPYGHEERRGLLVSGRAGRRLRCAV